MFAVVWKLIQSQIEKAQECQKFFYDKFTKQPDINVGDRVFVYHPAGIHEKAYKRSRPFSGPYVSLLNAPMEQK